MGKDSFEITINLVKLAVIFLMMVQMVPLLVWLERRGSAFIQNRFGPNRIGPLGLTQLLADAVKFIMKEEFYPEKGTKFLYYAAPVVALIPAALSLAAIPYSVPIHIEAFGDYGPYVFNIQGYEAGLGILFILSVSSLGAYSILMAGYGSANKYSLMGALRASAQLVSYELALSLSVIGVVLIYGTLNLTEIIKLQEGVKYGLPNWGILYQPIGFLVFFSCAFAECNRLPFDLAEAEGELVAGFHTEYGGFKMLLFFMGEYGHMMVASCLASIFFFGGYNIPYITPDEVLQLVKAEVSSGSAASILTSLIFLASFLIKVAFFLWLFVWARWTLPRFRYDQLMNLGWKKMLPVALANLILTAAVMLVFRGR